MRLYDSRAEMLEEVPKGASCCEIGVFALDLSRQILEIVQPSELLLVDMFPAAMFSCDEHGGNPRHLDGPTAFLDAVNFCAENPAVHLLTGRSSSVIPTLRPGLGFVYVDADHSYRGCLADLVASWEKLAPGGILAGHDYSLNEARVVDRSHYAGFGVKQAVDEFCEARGVEVAGLALDGYTSFLIRKPA